MWLVIGMQRGVCFEVTYSGLITDVQIRRQLISSAKVIANSLNKFFCFSPHRVSALTDFDYLIASLS